MRQLLSLRAIVNIGWTLAMKLLIDTNILIPLEPTRAADVEANTEAAHELARLAMELGHPIYRHPASADDFARDTDTDRRKLRSTKLEKYPILLNPPSRYEIEGLLATTSASPNDKVDLALLAALHAEAVEYLVTEDDGIHRRARRLGLEDRVLKLGDALDLLRALRGQTPPPPPHVRHLKSYSLRIRDPIFDSFRADYAGFDGWLRKVRQEHRDCWCIQRYDETYDAVAIVKAEDGKEIGASSPTLKICSFKVAESASGQKFGELLLKTIFEFAYTNGFDVIYVTVFEKHASLVGLLSGFGFEEVTQTTTLGEKVLVKRFTPSSTHDPLQYHVLHGPRAVRSYLEQPAFVVPIRPEFHDALFPEARRQQLLLGVDMPRPFGNAIRKAYLCNAQIRRLEPGDNLLFYRSQDAQQIACLGVVERIVVSSDATRVAREVGIRTVYSFAEIQRMAKDREVLAILFRHSRTLECPMGLEELTENDVLNGPPQSIVTVGDPGRAYLARRLRP